MIPCLGREHVRADSAQRIIHLPGAQCQCQQRKDVRDLVERQVQDYVPEQTEIDHRRDERYQEASRIGEAEVKKSLHTIYKIIGRGSQIVKTRYIFFCSFVWTAPACRQ